MKVLIIEDEQATAQRLSKLLQEIEPTIEVVDMLDSIESCVNWFKSNKQPDLIFQDIHLADGSSFEIFRQVEVKSPVIFVTAYDQYALQAFKVNSVDYLLKPVKKNDLLEALKKFNEIYGQKKQPEIDYSALAKLIQKDSFQKRFLVRYGEKIKAVEIENIAYFFTQEGNLFFKTFDNHQYPLEISLDKLEPTLDATSFYRINRQFIINYKAIKEMYSYSKSRVRIILNPPCEIETIASTERSGEFKQWLTGKS
jgi:two-component system LytT family response regulator